MKAEAYSVEESQETKNLTKRIARERIAPRSMERDVNGEFPGERLRSLGKAGLTGAIISEAQRGSGIGRPVFASIVEELAGILWSKDCFVTHED
jgi:alkylation response protein AidB-like acyl-CoA dehydrogenase